jgi:hypothetical protein
VKKKVQLEDKFLISVDATSFGYTPRPRRRYRLLQPFCALPTSLFVAFCFGPSLIALSFFGLFRFSFGPRLSHLLFV